MSELKERIKGRLGDLLPLKYGKSLPAASRDSTGSVPVYGSSGVVGNHSAALTSGPAIIVGRKGNVGAVHYSAVPCWPIDTAYFAEAPIGHDPRYYRYLLDSLGLARLDKSTAIPGLSRDDYNAVEVTIHPSEQQAEVVAEIEKQFSRLDEAVTNLQRVKANLKRYKASVLKAAVEGRLVETEASIAQREGRSYETGEQLLQRILEERRAKWSGKGKYKSPSLASSEGLPALPNGWSYATGGQLFRWSSGVNLPVKNLSGGEVPVYGGNGINGWHADSNISNSTLVIGRVGAGCGNVHLVMRKAWITDNAIYATEVPGSCDLRYLEIVFLTANLNFVAAGSGQPFVNQTILNDTIVPLPPYAEQTRIVAEVDRHLSIIRVVEAEVDVKIQRSQALRQATLSQFLGGNIK